MNERKKLLVVTPTFPYPIDAGGRIAQFYILEYLRHYFDITLVSLQFDNPHLNAFIKCCPNIELITIPVNLKLLLTKALLRIKSIIRTNFNATHPNKYFIEREINFLNSNALVLNFLKKIDYSGYDLVQFDFIESAPYLSKLTIPIKTLLVHHELRFIRCERELNIINLEDSRNELVTKLIEIKSFESAIIHQFDNVIVFSEVDKNKLLELLNRTKVHSSPFGIDIEHSERRNQFEFQNRIIYLGGERHYPNLDAVKWFTKNIWSLISKQHPNCKFLITGNWSEETKKMISNSQVEFTGMIENLSDIMDGSILVVPLRIGSGIRTKIFEAFAHRVPVISTNIGIEGIPAKNGIHCIIEDSPVKFAKSLSNLITNHSSHHDMIDNAWDLYMSNYTTEICGQRRLQIINNIISSVNK